MTSKQKSSRLNANYEPEIELVPPGGELTIKHDGKPNRLRVAADSVHNTRYSALLETVQYGTFEGDCAVLLVFALKFGFREQRRDRYVFASISVNFEETGDANFSPPCPRNFDNDPQVMMVLPVQVYGNPTPAKQTRFWSLAGSLTASLPIPGGPQVAVNPSTGRQTEADVNRRLNIQGERDGDDDHPRSQNAALWTIEENPSQQTGILHNWPIAVVMKMPANPERLVKAKMRIEASVKFSLNPARLWPKRDDPILLERDEPKGKQHAQGLDFADSAFPWADVVKIPHEYENILHL